jgi:VRR-NUC domain
MCSPILERRALYKLAVQSLEVLLFGGAISNAHGGGSYDTCFQVAASRKTGASLLSRRARGKALDRLIIDKGHLNRLDGGQLEKADKIAATRKFQQHVAAFTHSVVGHMAKTCSMAFSAVRTMARRLRQPLAASLHNISCVESVELGLRFSNSFDETENDNKYSDWSPIVDQAVANTIARDEVELGSRCSYVGFDDDAEFTSLNVEEFAMELYRSGRLSPGGGWVGWHDEGGHLRALFRIICAGPVLGMDHGCVYRSLNGQDQFEQATIHLSPYQHAPFDLHVGHEAPTSLSAESSRGFYSRRATVIAKFLRKLAALPDQSVADLVYEAVTCRMKHATARSLSDPFLDRDIAQIRTLSAVAAGFGGKLLAAAFRCLFFDYRHYSGGLPDLHLFRAFYVSESSDGQQELVDLGAWIGETFSADSQQAAATQRMVALLSDRDDEYLGCSKVGDSGSQASRSSRDSKLARSPKLDLLTTGPKSELIPDRLHLEHNGCKVKVECMMVEVKSANDRLDPRQEDWLNILDQHGNARVCKFEDTRKSGKKRMAKQ